MATQTAQPRPSIVAHWPTNSPEAYDSLLCPSPPANQTTKTAPTPWAEIAKEELKAKSQGRASASPSNIVQFRCPAAWRMQLRSKACDKYFPTEHMACIQGAMKYLTISAPHNPALAVVFDGSGLIQLGQDDGRMGMLQAGSRLYCQALSLLRTEIASPLVTSDGTSIAAIHVMQVCDMFTCMPFGALSWRQHAEGISSLLRTRRTKVQSNEFKALLAGNFRMFGLWHGILSRKGINHILPENVSSLEDIAVRIPGALEDCDALTAEPQDRLRVRAQGLLACLTEMETDLKQWSVGWYRNMRNPPFTLVQATALPSLPSTPQVFPQLLEFSSLSNATDHVLCTVCLLLIRQAMLQVNKMLQPETTKTHSNERAITDCADSLCMSIPYLCMPEHHFFGAHSALGPLMVAWKWYKTQPTSRKIAGRLQWCEQTGAQLRRERGLRMMATDLEQATLLWT